MNSPEILVVDDEAMIRSLLRTILERNGCSVRDVGSAEEALTALTDTEPHVAVVDLILPGSNGIELLHEIKLSHPDTEVVMMTGNATVESALEAVRRGAFDYMEKPFKVEDVWTVVQRAAEKRRLMLEGRAAHEQQLRQNRELSSALTLADQRELAVPAEILEQYLDVVVRELDVERASLMLVDAQTGELRVGAHRGMCEVDATRVRVRPGEGIAGQVLQSGEIFWSADAHSDERVEEARPELSDSFVSAPIKLSVPIKSQCEVLGVINVTNRRSGKPFDSEDVAFVQGLGGQLGVAIDWAQHAGELQQAYHSLKETQDQLVHSERIQAVGRMAAGVAHDFNNLLSVILARAELVRKMVESGSDDRTKILSDLDSIVRTAWLGAETVKRIQDYTRIRKDVPTSAVDLNHVIRNAVDIAKPKWQREAGAAGCEIDVRFELAEVPEVSGNVYELTQVVNNLIFNAVDAMPQGGLLTFRTALDGDAVVMQVEDTGTGMTEEVRQKLFDPFFTTKEAGQGLGTAILFGIVSRHGGEISVESEPGRGSSFTVRLPVLEEPVVEAGSEAEEADSGFVPGRVLLVDDEALVRETYEDALCLNGHEVSGAADGDEAMRLFGNGSYDLVITDLTMPGKSGLQLAEEVKRQSPSTPVILLSGWAVQQDQDDIRQSGVDDILVKPCAIADILAAIQRALVI